MPILYTVIARGNTILAKYASCVGNFSEVTEQILNRIPAEDSKLTYSHSNYLFHYVKEDGNVYLCITDDDFERARAFAYLVDIKRRFEQIYGGQRIREALPYAMHTDFGNLLASEMKRYSESRDLDKISKVEGQLDELKDIMVKNIDNIASRGERLELLVNKAENLQTGAVSFRKSSRNVARAMYWKNIKCTLMIAGVCLFGVYVVVSLSCGGLTWSGCFPASNSSTPP